MPGRCDRVTPGGMWGKNAAMDLPIELPVLPMLAKAASRVPAADALEGGCAYEPKWDGFRVILARDGDDVELFGRSGKALTRYFPEVVASALRHLPERIVLDGELVVRVGDPGAQRLDWEALSARIHPAASRIERLSTQTPAEVIAFDILALGSDDLTGRTLRERREVLDGLGVQAPDLHLTRITDDAQAAQRWFDECEGAGIDGVVAKGWGEPYAPGKRSMVKVKHKRTAEAVLVGYRVHKSGNGVGSLLLALYDAEGELRNVGGISAFTQARRAELIEELEPLVIRDEDGEAVRGERERNRFTSGKDVSFVALLPEKVVEVAFDQMEGPRFRHAVTFLRWRPDRDPRSCTLDQVDRAPAYDLGALLDG